MKAETPWERAQAAQNPICSTVFIDVISGCMQPILGCLGASGIIKGLLAFSVSMGWMDPSWGTYQVLYAFGDGFFYFLPIFLGYTSPKS